MEHDMNKAIYLKLGKPTDNLRVGQSHWWGYPDMPINMEVPTLTDADGNEYALDFLCQINLSDLHEFLNDTAAATGDSHIAQCPLPKSGLLLFFADIAYYLGNWDEPSISMHYSDNRQVRVIYVPQEQMAEVVSCEEFYADDNICAQPIEFALEKPGHDAPEHCLLGFPEHREWEDWDEGHEQWQLLLQMDSCEDDSYVCNFVDWGVLNLIISPEDLRRHDFSNVVGIILST